MKRSTKLALFLAGAAGIAGCSLGRTNNDADVTVLNTVAVTDPNIYTLSDPLSHVVIDFSNNDPKNARLTFQGDTLEVTALDGKGATFSSARITDPQKLLPRDFLTRFKNPLAPSEPAAGGFKFGRRSVEAHVTTLPLTSNALAP